MKSQIVQQRKRIRRAVWVFKMEMKSWSGQTDTRLTVHGTPAGYWYFVTAGDEWTVTGAGHLFSAAGWLHVNAGSTTVAHLLASDDGSRWTCVAGTDQQPSCGWSYVTQWEMSSPTGRLPRIFALFVSTLCSGEFFVSTVNCMLVTLRCICRRQMWLCTWK